MSTIKNIQDIKNIEEKLKKLDRAFIGAVSSALNYDSKEWVFNDQGRLHAISSNYLISEENHENGSITLALARYQSQYFEPVALPIMRNNVFPTSEKESIYFEYNPKTGSYFVPSRKQLMERDNNLPKSLRKNLASAVDNTHFNASLYVSRDTIDPQEPETTLHLVFRGTEKNLDSVIKKYGIDAYTDLDKYYRQMEVFESAIFEYLEKNTHIKEFSVTGHSLGGAMAQFFHEKHKDYFEKRGIKFYATTFGSPGADMKPWFSKIKDSYRHVRSYVDEKVLGISLISDYKEEQSNINFLTAHSEFLNPDQSLLSKGENFIKLGVASVSIFTSRLQSFIANSILEKVAYFKVDEQNLYKNNDTPENKINYDQQHYFHKNDPIPKVGKIAYNRNGEIFELSNYLVKQRGASKFFKSSMSEHSSDAYIHNVVNEIQKTYESNPTLFYNMKHLTPAFKEYVDGYNLIYQKKENLRQILLSHPEMKEEFVKLLSNNIFNAAKNKSGKTMAAQYTSFKIQEKEVEKYTTSLLQNISHNVDSFHKNITPTIFSNTPLVNGKPSINDNSDGILPFPKNMVISTIPRVYSEHEKPTFILENFKISSCVPTRSFNLKNADELLNKSNDDNLKSNSSHTELAKNDLSKNSFIGSSIKCTSPGCQAHDVKENLVKTVKRLSSKGELDSFLFQDPGQECVIYPEFNLTQYNVHALQSFHSEYTGDKLGPIDFIASKLGFKRQGKNVQDILNETQQVAQQIPSQIDDFEKSLQSMLQNPDVLSNIQKVVQEREAKEFNSIKEKTKNRIDIA